MSRSDRPATAALLALAGGGLGLVATTRPWVHAVVLESVLGQRKTIVVSGKDAAPAVVAVALVALAAGVALLLARTSGRRVIGLVLVLAGAAQVAATTSTVGQPRSSVTDQVARAVGATGSTDVSVTVTGWPWLAVVGGVLVVLAGVHTVLRARRWSAPTGRYEATATADGTPDAADHPEGSDAWDALTRGDDPTR